MYVYGGGGTVCDGNRRPAMPPMSIKAMFENQENVFGEFHHLVVAAEGGEWIEPNRKFDIIILVVVVRGNNQVHCFLQQDFLR